MIYFLLYNFLLILALPLYATYYLVLSFKNREYLNLFIQNFSFLYKNFHFGKNKRIWLHASSVGEVQALKPLVFKLLKNTKCKVIISTMTITGQEQVKKIFGNRVLPIYKPYDLGFFVSLCFKKIKPDMLIIMETELWPNIIKQAHKKNIPLYLINARLSDSSLFFYKKIRPLIAVSINFFNYIFVQSNKDEEKFLSLGAKKEKLHNCGNMKYDISVPENLNAVSFQIKQTLFNSLAKTSSKLWVAASTHHNEEELLIQLQQRIQKLEPQALLILAPRHPERFSVAVKLCEKKNINYVTRSSKKPCDNKTEVFILDSLGELIYFYHLAKVAFIGGSLVPVGGHNPLEAIAVNTAVTWGPYMFHFSEIKKLLLEKNLAQEVKTDKELDSIILKHLQKNKETSNFSPFLKKHSGAVDTIYQKIHQHLLL